MEKFTRSDLRTLITSPAAPGSGCVSLYMPTHRTGREIREDSLRCKNLLNEAEVKLQAAGMRSAAARDLLAPAWELHADTEFWKRQSDGLALFLAPGVFHHYRLPVPFSELLVVNERFHVKSVLPLLQGDGQFFVLSASQNSLRLFVGTRYGLSELSPRSLPKNLAEALNIDEYVDSLQQHEFRAAGAGNARFGIFHGHGGSDLDVKKKDEIREYFLRVDRGLDEFFGEERSPLVFAGVDYLFPMFRETSHYRVLIDEPITGNPELLPPPELHAKAWSLVQPHFARQQQAALKTYIEGAASPRAAHELEHIIRAAREGRVDTLFVANDQQLWGAVDSKTGDVQRREQGQPGSDDLLDYAAIETLLHRGTVYALKREQMPDHQPIAAILRYAVTEMAASRA
jgi:hypothetical protein